MMFSQPVDIFKYIESLHLSCGGHTRRQPCRPVAHGDPPCSVDSVDARSEIRVKRSRKRLSGVSSLPLEKREPEPQRVSAFVGDARKVDGSEALRGSKARRNEITGQCAVEPESGRLEQHLGRVPDQVDTGEWMSLHHKLVRLPVALFRSKNQILDGFRRTFEERTERHDMKATMTETCPATSYVVSWTGNRRVYPTATILAAGRGARAWAPKAKKTLSMQRPRPSMLIAIPSLRSRPAKASDVNWAPWSVLSI
jgi:hypothetical protein